MGEEADRLIDRMTFPDYDDYTRGALGKRTRYNDTDLVGSYVPTRPGVCKCGDAMLAAPPNMAGRKFSAGGKPFVVDYYCGRCKFVHVKYESGMRVAWPVGRLTPVEPWSPNLGYEKKTKAKAIFGKGQDMAQKTLYEMVVGGSVLYGHKLAVNSRGAWVMEQKGNGAIHTVSKDAVTEVMPYTVGVKFSGTSTEYHFFAKEGDVVVGDVMFMDGYSDWCKVTNVGTKSKRADKWLNGLRVTGTVVVNEGNED